MICGFEELTYIYRKYCFVKQKRYSYLYTILWRLFLFAMKNYQLQKLIDIMIQNKKVKHHFFYQDIVHSKNITIYQIRVNALEISIIIHYQANNSINQYWFIYSYHSFYIWHHWNMIKFRFTFWFYLFIFLNSKWFHCHYVKV
jgi:hypothetical protein